MMTLADVEATIDNIEDLCLFGFSPIREVLKSMDDEFWYADGNGKELDTNKLYWLVNSAFELINNFDKKLRELSPHPGLICKLDKILKRGQETNVSEGERERSRKLRETLVSALGT